MAAVSRGEIGPALTSMTDLVLGRGQMVQDTQDWKPWSLRNVMWKDVVSTKMCNVYYLQYELPLDIELIYPLLLGGISPQQHLFFQNIG